MGRVKRDLYKSDHKYLDYDYSQYSSVKRALRHYLKLKTEAENGDMVSTSIMVDLKSSLGCYHVDDAVGVLTSKQREAIILCLVQDNPADVVATWLGVDTRSVNKRIQSGVRAIIRYLTTGAMVWVEWTEAEKQVLKDFYYYKGATYCAEVLDRPIQQVYSKVRHMKRLGELHKKTVK